MPPSEAGDARLRGFVERFTRHDRTLHALEVAAWHALETSQIIRMEEIKAAEAAAKAPVRQPEIARWPLPPRQPLHHNSKAPAAPAALPKSQSTSALISSTYTFEPPANSIERTSLRPAAVAPLFVTSNNNAVDGQQFVAHRKKPAGDRLDTPPWCRSPESRTMVPKGCVSEPPTEDAGELLDRIRRQGRTSGEEAGSPSQRRASGEKFVIYGTSTVPSHDGTIPSKLASQLASLSLRIGEPVEGDDDEATMILTVPHDSGSGSGDGEPMSSPDPMSPPIGGPGFVGLEIAGLSLEGQRSQLASASGSHNASLGVGDKETSFRSSLGSHSMADSDDSANRLQLAKDLAQSRELLRTMRMRSSSAATIVNDGKHRPLMIDQKEWSPIGTRPHHSPKKLNPNYPGNLAAALEDDRRSKLMEAAMRRSKRQQPLLKGDMSEDGSSPEKNVFRAAMDLGDSFTSAKSPSNTPSRFRIEDAYTTPEAASQRDNVVSCTLHQNGHNGSSGGSSGSPAVDARSTLLPGDERREYLVKQVKEETRRTAAAAAAAIEACAAQRGGLLTGTLASRALQPTGFLKHYGVGAGGYGEVEAHTPEPPRSYYASPMCAGLFAAASSAKDSPPNLRRSASMSEGSTPPNLRPPRRLLPPSRDTPAAAAAALQRSHGPVAAAPSSDSASPQPMRWGKALSGTPGEERKGRRAKHLTEPANHMKGGLMPATGVMPGVPGISAQEASLPPMRYTLNNSVSHSMVPKVGGGGAAHSQPMTMVPLAAASPSKRVKPPAREGMPPFPARSEV